MEIPLRLCFLPLCLLAACINQDPIECASAADCLQGGIPGACLPSPSSNRSWCAFDDGSCKSGKRWGVRAGDGFERTCVDDAGADAGASDAASDAAPRVWSKPSIVPNVNSVQVDFDPSLSSTGLELYFASTRAVGRLGDIYVATRLSTSDEFDPAEAVAVINSDGNELGPDLTADGRELFFERAGQGILVTKRLNTGLAWLGVPQRRRDWMDAFRHSLRMGSRCTCQGPTVSLVVWSRQRGPRAPLPGVLSRL